MAEEKKVTAPVAESITIKKGEPIKNMLNTDSLHEFALTIKSAYELFPIEEFVEAVMDDSWDALELKARGRQVTVNLKNFCPKVSMNVWLYLIKLLIIIHQGFFS